MLRRGLLAAAILATTAVRASPFDIIDKRDVFVDPATCDPLVYGATAIPMGQVCVGISRGTLTIVYTVNAGWRINKVHAMVGPTFPTITAPGQFTYSSDKGTPPACTVASDGLTTTCSTQVQSAWRACDKTLYIVTHADVAGPGTIGGQTAWGKGTCYPDSKGNCAKYWTFTQRCICDLQIDFFPITYTTTSVTTITGSSTSSFLTSTTIEYETSSTSTYVTSTTVTYLTSTTSEYSTTLEPDLELIPSSLFTTTPSHNGKESEIPYDRRKADVHGSHRILQNPHTTTNASTSEYAEIRSRCTKEGSFPRAEAREVKKSSVRNTTHTAIAASPELQFALIGGLGQWIEVIACHTLYI
ncbi:hypothetical protein VTL71DRAFT_15191 [Oculimacula yallundae]|uniref:Uncharacterized protein n=1 Tax=Oculimacula yallundae TaxID=86028 RepID=A0ABR4CFV9_9HELO